MSFSCFGDLRRDMHRTRIVYFCRCGEFLKIGITDDLPKRVRNIQAMNPQNIVLEAYRTVPSLLARQIEMRIHEALAHYNHRGEWFNVETVIALRAASTIIRRAKRVHTGWITEIRHGDDRAIEEQAARDVGRFIAQAADEQP
jgi:NDP-sugar pyrophosphorylase family protein